MPESRRANRHHRDALLPLGVDEDHIHVDHGLNGGDRARSAFLEETASVRRGVTLVVTKFDCLARSWSDARDIEDELKKKGVVLSLGGSVNDPIDPVGPPLFDVLGIFAEFEADLIRMRTCDGIAVARARGRLRGKKPKLSPTQRKHLLDSYDVGTHTQAELAHLFRMSRTNVYRELQRCSASATTASEAQVVGATR